MSGNVREWVADWYNENYYAISPDENPPGPDTGNFRVARGGSWADTQNGVRTFTRFPLNPAEANSYLGFRCARSAND